MVLENFTKSYLCPDYDESLDVEVIEDEDDLKDIREIKKENNNPKNNFNMNSTPFGSVPFQSISTPTPKYSWAGSGNNNNNTNNNTVNGNILSTADNTGMGFKPLTPNANQTTVETINRNKRYIFCDFLDCVTETLSSNGIPGLVPRDVYDLKPRFEVWNKLAAFNPEKLFVLVPSNLVSNTVGVNDSWTITINYFCLALCSYIRIPIESCLSLSYDPFVPKDYVMAGTIDSVGIADKKDIVSIGIYSGINGQSNRDVATANRLGIDYVDLFKLINNMF